MRDKSTLTNTYQAKSKTERKSERTCGTYGRRRPMLRGHARESQRKRAARRVFFFCAPWRKSEIGPPYLKQEEALVVKSCEQDGGLAVSWLNGFTW